jgi:hypothetical protein
MADDEWLSGALDAYGLPAAAASAIVRISHGAAADVPVLLSPADIAHIVPAAAEHREEALSGLGGLFVLGR